MRISPVKYNRLTNQTLKTFILVFSMTFMSSLGLAETNELAGLDDSQINANCLATASFSNDDKITFEKTTNFINLLSVRDQTEVLNLIQTQMKKAKNCQELTVIMKETQSSLAKTWDQFMAFKTMVLEDKK